MSALTITIPQPEASLLVARQPSIAGQVVGTIGQPRPMVKRFITRSEPCPPKFFGQRVAIHAALRGTDKPTNDADRLIGEFRKEDGRTLSHPTLGVIDLPLGKIVGSGIVTASYPIVDRFTEPPGLKAHVCVGDSDLILVADPDGYDDEWADISDQLPYGDFTPGRFAWLIEDAAPITERCPWCWGEGYEEWNQSDDCQAASTDYEDYLCPACKGVGRCDPIPAVGRPGWWNWESAS